MSFVTRNRFAGVPFEDNDEAIVAALEDVSVPALMCSLVHMSGDPSWVRGEIQPNVAVSLDIQGAMSPEDMAEVRRRALPAIAAYRDNGCVPAELSREILQEMMGFLGRRPVEGQLAGLFFDDLQFEGGDSGEIAWGNEISAARKVASPVVVIGCGMGGILAGIRLKQAGLPFTIVDKNGGPGGTWWENRYPGVRASTSGAISTASRSSRQGSGASTTASSRSSASTSGRSSTNSTSNRTAASRPPSLSWSGKRTGPCGASASATRAAPKRCWRPGSSLVPWVR